MLVIMLLTNQFGMQTVNAQTGGEAERLFAKLTPEEKVGQLFLVSFDGRNTTETSNIYELIANQHVGGVILRADRDNFTEEFTTTNARELIDSLQTINAAKSSTNAHTPIPLYIGISQEGGGYPNDQILNGLARIPNEMAIGATWNPSLAEQSGQLLGMELTDLGFNFYYGLSLDVLTLNDPSMNPDLSTRLFGGDPYWVSKMGKAFIAGLRAGSNNKMAIIAKHFPGRGGSDREAEQEIPTVRKSLDELKAYELAPFFAVTGNASDPTTQIDGLLVTHIRYQGFQGNIRATTRPISFDQQALGELIALPAIDSWRQQGGLIVSDDLGTEAVKNFYDPNGSNFSARLVSRDAFLAGNDLLMMGNITSTVDGDNTVSLVKTIEFFAQRYQDDKDFANRVDQTVLRILMAKEKQLGSFAAFQVQSPTFGSNNDLLRNDIEFDVAKRSATLINPSLAELSAVIPDPPQTLDYIVFLTDSRSAQQCSTCPNRTILPTEQFQTVVNRLYGPLADGLVIPSHLSSFSFDALTLMLDDRLEDKALINAIGRAEWVVISAQDMPEGTSQLTTLRRFLNEKQGLLTNKKVILFSFGAPYFLGATDISKLTAFYAMYNPSESFVNIAARLLFQEITPVGSSPVSISGIGYDLITVTSPNSDQVITLSIEPAGTQPSLPFTPPGLETSVPNLLQYPTITPQPTVSPTYKVGDTLTIKTGVILDKNQHEVPDGTPVIFSLKSADALVHQMEAQTVEGVARSIFRLDKGGFIEISAVSEPAKISEIIQLDVNQEGSTIIIVTPTPDRLTEQPTPLPVSTAPAEDDISAGTVFLTEVGLPTFMGWMLIVSVMLAVMFLSFIIANQFVDSRWSIRFAILALIGGLFFYNSILLSLSPGDTSLSDSSFVSYIQKTLLGQLIGLVIAGGWLSLAKRGNKAEKK